MPNQKEASRRSTSTGGASAPLAEISSAMARPAAPIDADARSLTAKTDGRSPVPEIDSPSSLAASPPRDVQMSRAKAVDGARLGMGLLLVKGRSSDAELR